MNNFISILIYGIVPMTYLVCAFFWGDWRHWKKYYPTILFVVLLDLFANNMMQNHFLWRFGESIIIPNHTLTDFMIAFIIFPSAVLIFLTNYPNKWTERIAWVFLWVLIYSLTEYLDAQNGTMTYHNGWSFWYSALFNVITFPVLRLHYKKPLLAWLAGIPVFIFIMWHFNFSIKDLK